MQISSLLTLNSVKSLKKLMDSQKEIYLYGAGYYLEFFLQEIENLDKAYYDKIKCIFVSNADGSPEKVRGIPVFTYYPDTLGANDCVLLTLGHRYTDEVFRLLQGTGAHIAEIDFNMFQEIPYHEVKKSITSFLAVFPERLSGLNVPLPQNGIVAWTCWWQGEEQAPEIVRACLESQRKNLPYGVKHVVITENNYQDYITLPEYILKKVKAGNISLTTLSDIIRAALLYKYGGFWMDSTLLVCKPLDRSILDYPFYTRNLPETHCCSNAMWSGWFLYTRPGSKLFCFLMESFFYYFSMYSKIKYYFMIDYLIAIASNTFRDIEEQLKAVPYNNEGAQELIRHITEPFVPENMAVYIKNSSIQKLSYKISLTEIDEPGSTIYGHIIKEYCCEPLNCK
jgi:hypothetical protein|nr:capsular polysaccharide synthesis protein [uncultured Schaedlerella sp.]